MHSVRKTPSFREHRLAISSSPFTQEKHYDSLPPMRATVCYKCLKLHSTEHRNGSPRTTRTSEWSRMICIKNWEMDCVCIFPFRPTTKASETHNPDTRPRISLDGVVSVCISSERRRHFENDDCPLALRHLRKRSTVTAFLPCVPPSGVQVSEIAQHEAQEWQPANNKDLGMVSHDLHRELGNGLCLVPVQLMD
ncbi:hypothetical protein CDAR_208731 [Caerostris darwini]|uniref:Uncharacterized protein n=1 Tax=Caerostris darwini TaxID=1538125 RepID=A0AAV4VPY0_9ARAC|nr:hypothetical protein CDAR_208731 [Caerostris darwini]